jgi:hypothetical protein
MISRFLELFDFTIENLTTFLDDIKNTDLSIRAKDYDRSYYREPIETQNDTQVFKETYPQLHKWLI